MEYLDPYVGHGRKKIKMGNFRIDIDLSTQKEMRFKYFNDNFK